MKSTLSIIFLVISTIPVFSIDQYAANDSLYVWAKSGLSVRATPSKSAEKIAVLPFGTLVIPQTSKWEAIVEKGAAYILETKRFKVKDKKNKGIALYGAWVKVTVGEVEGYVFDAYLSAMITPTGDKQDDIFGYFKNTLKILERISERGNSDRGANRFTFQNGIIYQDYAGEGAFDFEIFFSRLSLEEGYLIVNYLYGEEVVITMDDENTISFMDNDGLGGITIKRFNGTLILSGSWSC